MTEQPGPGFGAVLKILRDDARLTQEELALAAGVSTRGVSDLERGVNRTAHKKTADLLAGPLRLTGVVRDEFVAAALGLVPPCRVLEARDAAGTQARTEERRDGVRYSLPPRPAAFTGREAELGCFTTAVKSSAGAGGVMAIHAIDGMPGVGKTALAVHAAHEMAKEFPDRQLFIDLHAHTPGRDPVCPEDALAGLLAATGVDPRFLPGDLEGRAGEVL